MKLSKVMLCLFFLALAASCGKGDKAKWTEYTSEEGNFTVLMPNPEIETEQSTQNTAAGPVEVYSYSTFKGTTFFMVKYNDMNLGDVELTGADKQEILESGVDGALNAYPDGEFIYKRDITLDGHPGKEYRLEGTKNDLELVTFGRIYLVDSRLYQTVVTATYNEAGDESIAKFLNSFKL